MNTINKTLLTLLAVGAFTLSAQASTLLTYDTRHDENSAAGTLPAGSTALQPGNWFGATTNPGILDVNLSASNVTFGSGFFDGQTDQGAQFSDTGVNSATAAAGLAANEFLSFTLTPDAGFELAIDSISFGAYFQSAGTSQWALYSSLDGFSTALASDLAYSASGANLVTAGSLGITGQTSAVEFRLAFGHNSEFERVGIADVDMTSIGVGGTGWPDYGKTMAVDGTISAIPEPSTFALVVALGALVLFRRRR